MFSIVVENVFQKTNSIQRPWKGGGEIGMFMLNPSKSPGPPSPPDAKDLVRQAINHYNNKEYQMAIPLFQKAAESGNIDAQYWLGRCFYNGLSVKKDYSQAVYWYRKAAEQGDAAAQNNLGLCYEDGDFSLTKDVYEAGFWYRKAAE